MVEFFEPYKKLLKSFWAKTLLTGTSRAYWPQRDFWLSGFFPNKNHCDMRLGIMDSFL